jgi:HSP20 family protein
LLNSLDFCQETKGSRQNPQDKIARGIRFNWIEIAIVRRIRIPRSGQKGGGLTAAGTDPPTEEKTMNALTKWNPFRELEEIQNRLSSVFGRTPVRGSGQEAMTFSEWTPLVDITEDDKEYLIKAELPEVKKEDVKVTVENGTLTITGERKFEKEEKGKKYHRMERAYGSFMRSFTLPETAAGDKVSADFKDGVLKVHLPKSAEAKPRSIEVQVS